MAASSNAYKILLFTSNHSNTNPISHRATLQFNVTDGSDGENLVAVTESDHPVHTIQ